MRWFYRCPSCGAVYPIEPGRYLCGPCAAANKPGMPLEGVLECVWEDLSPAKAAAEREKASSGLVPLPVERGFFPPLPVGDTPLWEPERLRRALDEPGLYLKDDTCEPSGSYKDRASWLVAAFARKHAIEEIALASTGNAASSMACVGAAAGLKIKVFLPRTAPAAKRVQVLQYGAELVEIDGTYYLAFEQCMAYTEATGVLSRNTAYNPLTIEGKKTASFELAHQVAAGALGMRTAPVGGGASAWAAPDHVFVPTGDGVILAGLIKGFEDLIRLGLVDRMPTFWAAQAEGSSAIARALETGALESRPSSTIADSISVDAPRNGSFVLRKMREFGGRAETASDEEILDAQRLLASGSGLFAEPSSACAFAAYLKARPLLGKASKIVVMLTGSGLKDIRNAAKAVNAQL